LEQTNGTKNERVDAVERGERASEQAEDLGDRQSGGEAWQCSGS